MPTSLATLLQQHPHSYLLDSDLKNLLGGTPDARYSKVKRLIAQKKLLHIRRGLYCITPAISHLPKPHPYELAQYIYGPSYISMESALSFHKLIPETVYTITSATPKRAQTFQTPLGIFSYMHLPLENFYVGVELMREDNYAFFVATPWKAICDYVFCYKKDWADFYYLTENLRINKDALPILRITEMQSLEEFYHHSRITKFLKRIMEQQ